jgi:putative ABC transport system permease protein
MVTNRFVFANLLHRPMRAFASVLAISLEVLLILMIVGFCRGVIADSASRQQGIGADIFLQPPNAPPIFTSSGVVMPISDAERLRQIAGFRAAAPVLYQIELQDGLVTIFGIDLKSFDEVSGGLTYLQGGPFSSASANEIIIDDLESQSKHLQTGDTREFKGQRFRVCGVVQHGKGARVFMPIETMQELVGRKGMASMMFIKCDHPDLTRQVLKSIETILPGYRAFSVQDWVSRIMNTNPPVLDVFLNVVVGVAVLIGSFAIFLSLYTTITERTRDIGILKSMGASKPYIMGIILRESLALCIMGLILGLALTALGRSILHAIFPTQQVLISLSWILRSALLVLASGLLGAIYPAMQAASKDPIHALAYE